MGAYLDGALYIVKDRSSISSNVHMCPSHLLPYTDPDCVETHVTGALKWDDHGVRFWDGGVFCSFLRRILLDDRVLIVDATYSGLETWFEALGVVTAPPIRGAALATIHHINIDDEPNPRAINIRFWSYTESTDGHVAPSRRLSPAHTLNVLGMLATVSSPHHHLIAYSDISALLIVQYGGSRSLRLIRYEPSTICSTIHRLESPPSLDLTTVSNVALDGHRGAVILIDRDGVLYYVSYA